MAEVPMLQVTVSLLTNFEKVDDIYDWNVCRLLGINVLPTDADTGLLQCPTTLLIDSTV
jgi:hypothetical protein